MERKLHKIDVSGKTLGRVASEIAVLLRGKNKVGFQPYKDEGDIVEVINADKIKVTGKKMQQKIYYHHSGYPGGIKSASLADKMSSSPEFALRTAVYHMLPDNNTRAIIIKRLRFIASK